jgi:hypothetical protein
MPALAFISLFLRAIPSSSAFPPSISRRGLFSGRQLYVRQLIMHIFATTHGFARDVGCHEEQAVGRAHFKVSTQPVEEIQPLAFEFSLLICRYRR